MELREGDQELREGWTPPNTTEGFLLSVVFCPLLVLTCLYYLLLHSDVTAKCDVWDAVGPLGNRGENGRARS